MKKSQNSSPCWFELNGSNCQCPQCWGCRRKRPLTQAEAQDVARSMNDAPNRRNSRTKAYDCPYCDDWHVGHDNKLVPLWKQNRGKNGKK